MSDAKMPTGWAWDDEMQVFWRLANFLDPADKGFSITVERMRELLATRGLALVPAADVERLAALEAQSKLYDQECGMCGSTAEELVEYQQWLESGKPTDAVTPEERAVLEACATAEVAQLSNGWRMLDGDSNRAVTAAELARRAAKEAKG